MEKIFLERLEELDISENDKIFILNNIKICARLYFRGIRDTLL